MNDGDEGPQSDAAFVALTSTDVTAPTITQVKAIVDGTFAGQADATDVHRFIFSEPMAATVAADGSAYRGQDGDGTVADITCGTAGTTCVLNQSTVTIGAATQPAGTVLTVTIGSIPSFTAPGTSPGLQYPVVVTQVTSQWDDTSGNQLDLVGSVDKTIEVDEAAPPTEPILPTATAPPRPQSSPETLTVTFSEPVEYLGPASEFTILDSGKVCGDHPVTNGTGTDGERRRQRQCVGRHLRQHRRRRQLPALRG